MKHRNALVVPMIAAVLFAAGCRSPHRDRYPEQGTVTKPDVISCWGNWVKDKGERCDVSIGMRNESSNRIIVLFDDITASRGGAEASVHHAAGFGEQVIDLAPGQTKPVTLACEMRDAKSSGPLSVTIRKVYDNPVGDGRTCGSVIAENVVWTAQ